jgi:hypothetical protein
MKKKQWDLISFRPRTRLSEAGVLSLGW